MIAIKRTLLFGTFILLMVLIMPLNVTAVHDPVGERANEGSKSAGTFAAFDNPVPTDGAFNPITIQDYWGDMYVVGESNSLTHVLNYYCMIKISPEDTNHPHLQIRVNLDWDYSISATSLGSAAKWELSYHVFDMSQANFIQLHGWCLSYWHDEIAGGLWWTESKENQHFDSSSGYFTLYNRPDWMIPGGHEDDYICVFSPSEWYYVGFKLTISLMGVANLYDGTSHWTSAHLNPYTIYWNFFN